MKETLRNANKTKVVSIWQDENYPFIRSVRPALITAAGIFGFFAAVAALKYEISGPPIEEGVVYKMEYSSAEHFELFPGNPFPFPFISADYPEKRKIYIAQCLNGNMPPKENIENICKTNSFEVSSEVFSQTKLGQKLNLKQGE